MEENVTTIAAEAVAENTAAVAEETVPQKRKRKPINQQKLQDNLWGWIFVLPLLIGTIWFVYSAFVMALMLSFSDFPMGMGKTLSDVLGDLGGNAFQAPVYETNQFGMQVQIRTEPSPFWWYIQAFTKTVATTNDTSVAQINELGAYLFNTVFYLIGIPIGMILSVFFAVCMSRDIKGGNVFRVLYYVPCVASTISIVYTFRIMFSVSGVINNMLGTKLIWLQNPGYTWNDLAGNVENPSTSDFMNNPFWCQGIISKCVIIIMSVWKGLGGTIILYVAGLSSVNAATKEAAQIDGASGWKIFWKVTMPDLYPTIFYNIVTSVIGGMQIYAEPVLLNDENILTSGYVSLIYRYGLNTDGGNGQAGKDPSAGAAYGMILAVIIFVMTLFQFWLDSRKKD